jgi:cyclic pyranopterin phosphate synthase
MQLARIFGSEGVNKIRLTGGEPSIRPDIEELCEQPRSLPGLRNLAATSNGIVLSRKLARLQVAGLNQLNISLDTLVPAKFEFLTRRKGHNKVLQSIEATLDLGFSPVKKQQFPGLQRLQDHHTDTAKNFQVPGFKGTVSFVTSMTQHFCAGCN